MLFIIIGAAASEISGEYFEYFDFSLIDKNEAKKIVFEKAKNIAIQNGANKDNIKIIFEDISRLSYTSENTFKVYVKVGGPIKCNYYIFIQLLVI